jgi:hypothetical protein
MNKTEIRLVICSFLIASFLPGLIGTMLFATSQSSYRWIVFFPGILVLGFWLLRLFLDLNALFKTTLWTASSIFHGCWGIWLLFHVLAHGGMHDVLTWVFAFIELGICAMSIGCVIKDQ